MRFPDVGIRKLVWPPEALVCRAEAGRGRGGGRIQTRRNMDTQQWTEQIAAVDRQVQELRSAGDPVARHDLLLNAAFQELHTTLEELRVAEEELRQQNDELALAGLAVEAERLRYQDLFES